MTRLLLIGLLILSFANSANAEGDERVLPAIALPAEPGAPPSPRAIPAWMPQLYLAPPQLVDATSMAKKYRVAGGATLGPGIAFMGAALALGIDAARYHGCDSHQDDVVCLGVALGHTLEIPFAVLIGAIGTAATVTGAVLLGKSATWAKKARLTPTVALGPSSGSVGLSLRL